MADNQEWTPEPLQVDSVWFNDVLARNQRFVTVSGQRRRDTKPSNEVNIAKIHYKRMRHEFMLKNGVPIVPKGRYEEPSHPKFIYFDEIGIITPEMMHTITPKQAIRFQQEAVNKHKEGEE